MKTPGGLFKNHTETTADYSRPFLDTVSILTLRQISLYHEGILGFKSIFVNNYITKVTQGSFKGSPSRKMCPMSLVCTQEVSSFNSIFQSCYFLRAVAHALVCHSVRRALNGGRRMNKESFITEDG